MLSFVFRATVLISQMNVRVLKLLYFLYLISLPNKLTFFGIRREEILLLCNVVVVRGEYFSVQTSAKFREGVRYVKTQLSCILLYYVDDDMFRPLWAIYFATIIKYNHFRNTHAAATDVPTRQERLGHPSLSTQHVQTRHSFRLI
jgi:hypothetical protein